MPPDIIQTQQEVARETFWELLDEHDIRKMDALVATIIANVGRELEASLQEEVRLSEHSVAINKQQQREYEVWQRAMCKAITLIRSITGISPTR